MQGYRSVALTDKGKRRIVFNPKDGYLDMPVTVPCGQCVGCRLERSRQWAIRCVHEASLYSDNCFITLTFDNEHLPSDGSLAVEYWQKFMKRLRKHHQGLSAVENDDGEITYPIRFYHCGEYGEKYGRPHYHAILFNFDFPDKKLHKVNNGHRIYTSEILEKLWPYGYASVGSVTFESAAYVARYIMKKVTGDAAEDHYQRVDPTSGEISQLKPEYTTMSRNPGLGKGWYDKYKHTDCYDNDFVIMLKRGKMKPPKFYDSLFEIEYPDDYAKIKSCRKHNATKHTDNNSQDRLIVREKVQKAKLNKLVRNLDSGG